MKIGIYGGTFDPPHLGHMAAAQEVTQTLGLDKLILVPAKLPPHKKPEAVDAGADDRFAMTAILADDLGAEVDDLELRREGKSYTADTLRAFKERYPDDELWLLMGSDMFLTVQDWYEPETIFSLAKLCAFSREGEGDMAALRDQADRLAARFGTHAVVLALEQGAGISSTQLRQELERGERPAGLSERVYGYILRHKLYGVDVDLKHLSNADLRAVSYSMMRAKRVRHVQGTEEESVKLAQRWGGDVELARRAAILHDCTKYYTVEQHFAVCKQYGVELDALELASEKLLHAKTGAALACHIFGEPVEVQSAIYYHTTGKGNMTVLEKILYLADYMEPTRNFPGVEKLRELAYKDLDAAVALGCEMSIAEVEEKKREVHPNTRAAYESLRKGKE